VGSDVSVDNETFLVTDFINLKIKLVQSFEFVHMSKVYMYIFIGVGAHIHMSIYICAVFQKN
jgi:hypothetical protein